MVRGHGREPSRSQQKYARRKLARMQPRGEIPGAGAGRQASGGFAAAAAAPRTAAPSAHAAVAYRTADEYARAVGGFLQTGLDASEPVMAAVPAPRADLIRNYLGVRSARVSFAEMRTLGQNPARIIPAIQAFADSHPGQLLHYVGEPDWPSRTAPERAEVMRHEALLNVAFHGRPVKILCAYDAGGLGAAVIAQAERAHPVLMRNGDVTRNPGFAGAWPPSAADRALASPPAGLRVLTYRDDPAAARRFARQMASAAGLAEPRLTDLVIAVGELAANTLRHTRGSGSVRVWAEAGEVVCEVRDSGHIQDALAGRRYPATDAGRGHGLWVVHQVCDLVEMRTSPAGTVFRLHMGL